MTEDSMADGAPFTASLRYQHLTVMLDVSGLGPRSIRHSRRQGRFEPNLLALSYSQYGDDPWTGRAVTLSGRRVRKDGTYSDVPPPSAPVRRGPGRVRALGGPLHAAGRCVMIDLTAAPAPAGHPVLAEIRRRYECPRYTDWPGQVRADMDEMFRALAELGALRTAAEQARAVLDVTNGRPAREAYLALTRALGHDLDTRDVTEIRWYLRIADEIQDPGWPAAVHELTAALDRWKGHTQALGGAS